MKGFIRLISCMVGIAILLTTPCFATQTVSFDRHTMSIQLPDDFVEITAQNASEYTSFLEQHSPSATPTHVTIPSDYLYVGVSATMECTVFLSAITDQVSATIGDLITYQQKEVAKKLLLGTTQPDTVTLQELEQRGALFYRVDCGVTQGIGRIMYITVMNGTCYTLGLIDNSGRLSQNIHSLIDTVFEEWQYVIEAEQQKVQQTRQKAMTIFYWICLPVGLFLIGLLIRSMIHEYRNKQLNAGRKKIIPKKPRR